MIPGHIQYLLYRHDCVIVPGFGGFISQKRAAERTRKEILPPQRIISFNKKIITNDGLLSHRVATAEKITHEQALVKIQETVKEWNKILDDKKLLHLQGIGHFENSGNNRWVFHPGKGINFFTESFGLSPVKALPIMHIKRNHRALRYAAAAVFFLTAIGYGWYYRNYLEPLQRESLDALSSIVPFSFREEYKDYSNRNYREEEKRFSGTIIQQQPNIESAKETPVKEKSSIVSKNYYVIAGVFASEKRAKKLLGQLKKDHSLAQIFKENQRFFVAYGNYSTTEEAQAELNVISIPNPDDQPWIKISQ